MGFLNPGVVDAATVEVKAGGDLQAAINAAQPGDTILLTAGVTYVGNFELPVKIGAEYITIRTADRPGQPGATTRVSITATDLSREMVERTKAGRFTQLEVNRGLPAPMLVRHFTRAGSEWEVAPQLRRMVTASECNLAAPLPRMGPFDVVYLRNVLIYFDLPTKQAILRRVRDLMRPDGWLFLGAAETTLGVDDSWERVVVGRSSAYRPL